MAKNKNQLPGEYLLMPYHLRLLGLVNGGEHFASGHLVKSYDASYVLPDGSYDGGLLEVTDDPAEALAIPSAAAAFQIWKTQAPPPFDIRPDGQANRPLTAFSVSVELNITGAGSKPADQ